MPKVSIVDQLAQINVKPEQIKYVGISHYHADHTGQVASFPGATVLIGKGDWDGITAPKPKVGPTWRRSRTRSAAAASWRRCRVTRMCLAMARSSSSTRPAIRRGITACWCN